MKIRVPENRADDDIDDEARIKYLESFIPKVHLDGLKRCLEATDNPYMAALEMWGACLWNIKIDLEEEDYNQKVESSLRN